MSDPIEVEIVEAIRERMEDEGFDVFLGTFVDPDQVSLPAAVVQMTEDGIRQIEQRFPAKAEMSIACDLWYRIDQKTDEHLMIQGLRLCRQVRDALVQRPPKDRPDTLGSLADKIEHEQTVVMTEDQQSTIGLAQVTITVTYYDED